MNARNGHPLEYFPAKLSWFGRFLWRIWVINIFPDCDGVCWVFIRWNPLSYVFAILLVIGLIFIGGVYAVIESCNDNRLGFCYSQYWRENVDKVEFITRTLSDT